jgi:hypothetical protein
LDLAGIFRQRQQARELTIMTRPIDPSRDLLFGLVALQNSLIDSRKYFSSAFRPKIYVKFTRSPI